MDRQTFLANKIEELLNLHPELRFKVLDNVADLDDFYGDMIKDFSYESPHFWCLLTEYMGEYLPIPDSVSTVESCVVYLHVPNIFVNLAFDYLKNDFAKEIVAKTLIEENRRTIMTMNIPEIIDSSMKDGIGYSVIRIMFSFKSSATYVFGNDIEIKIDGVQVTPVDGRQIDQLKENKTVQFLGTITSVSTTLENVVKHSHIFYYENKAPFNKLLSEITEGKQNIIYNLEYRFPNMAPGTYKLHKVILDSGTYIFPLGQFILLNCVFTTADLGV